jgi:hypothetical protein
MKMEELRCERSGVGPRCHAERSGALVSEPLKDVFLNNLFNHSQPPSLKWLNPSIVRGAQNEMPGS